MSLTPNALAEYHRKFPHLLTREKLMHCEDIYCAASSKANYDTMLEAYFRAQMQAFQPVTKNMPYEQREAVCFWAMLITDLKEGR